MSLFQVKTDESNNNNNKKKDEGDEEDKKKNEENEEIERNPWTSINKMLCNNRCFICTNGFPRGKKKKVFMVSQILQSFTAIYSTKGQPLKDDVADSTKTESEQNEASDSTADKESDKSSKAIEQSSVDKVTSSSEINEESNNVAVDGVDQWSLDPRSGMDPRLILFINFKEQCPYIWACWQNFYDLAGQEQKLVDLLADGDVQVWMSGLACCRSEMCAAMYRAITSDNSKNDLIASILASKEKFTHKNTFCPPDCDCDNPWQFMNL